MEWNDFSKTVSVYCNDKAADIDNDDRTTVLRMIERGNATEKKQARCTIAIRLIVGEYSDSPLASKGFELPTNAAATVENAFATINGLASVFDSDPVIQALLLPHGRSKASHYDGASWTEVMTGHMFDTARTLYESKTWDGSLKSLIATVQTGGQS